MKLSLLFFFLQESANKSKMSLDSVPEDVLFEVFLRLPAKDLVKSCVLVCRRWRNIIDSEGFWRAKCVQDNSYSSEILHCLPDEKAKLLYFKKPYMNNLVKNPDASGGNLFSKCILPLCLSFKILSLYWLWNKFLQLILDTLDTSSRKESITLRVWNKRPVLSYCCGAPYFGTIFFAFCNTWLGIKPVTTCTGNKYSTIELWKQVNVFPTF